MQSADDVVSPLIPALLDVDAGEGFGKYTAVFLFAVLAWIGLKFGRKFRFVIFVLLDFRQLETAILHKVVDKAHGARSIFRLLLVFCLHEIRHIVYCRIGRCRLALLLLLLLLFGIHRYGSQEVVDEVAGAVAVFFCSRFLSFRFLQLVEVHLWRVGFYLIMGCLYHLEDDFSVGDVDGCPAQFFVETRVVKQVQILQHQQTCRLIIRI